MFSISLRDVKKYYGIDMILEDISFDIEEGQKAAIIGANGAGKTTLFNIISKKLEYDSGDIFIAKGSRLGYLSQIPVFPEGFTVRQVIEQAFENIYELKSKIEALEIKMASEKDSEALKDLMREYDNLKYTFERSDGYNIDYKIDLVANGLGIKKEDFDKKFDLLSGGEKTRICMAKLLAEETDILFLDEPTNHLDMESVEWLEEFLTTYKGTALVISHDRYFMDKVVTKVIEIENGLSNIYEGNYSYYIEEKERRVEKQMRDYQNQQKQINKMEETIDRFRNWSNYKAAMSIEKALSKIQRVDGPSLKNKKIRLNFESEQKSGNDVLKITNLSKRYDDKIIFESAAMDLYSGSKAVILGKNGAGKSTLVKMVLGEEKCDSGYIKLGTNVRIAYLEQQFDTLLGVNKTVLEYFVDAAKLTSNKEARNILAAFLFFGEDVFKEVASLSGGEKTRLKLAELMHSDNNLLILDEPTNHLDIDSKEALEEAIRDYTGTVLIISHDRYFINKIADVIYEVDDGKISVFEGDYDYFKRKKDILAKQKDQSARKIPPLSSFLDEKTEASVSQASEGAKDSKNNSNRKRKSPKRELEKLEKKISKLEDEINETNLQLAKPEVAADYEQVMKISKEKEIKEEELEKLYGEWEEISLEVEED